MFFEVIVSETEIDMEVSARSLVRRQQLEPLGYKCIALPLLAVQQKPAVKDLQPDTDALRNVVLGEIDAGNDVVMVVHSWSGIIANGALVGLGKAEREKEGKKGGVLRIAYICSFAPPENVSLVTAFGGVTPEWYDVKEPWVTPKGAEDLFYNDLSPEDAKFWASKLKPHSYATKFVGAKGAAWRTIPSTYLLCEDDRAIPLPVQEAMVKACQDSGAPMETERVFSSHSPFLSKPDEVVAYVRRAAGEKV